jgi:hypothetical protein
LPGAPVPARKARGFIAVATAAGIIVTKRVQQGLLVSAF